MKERRGRKRKERKDKEEGKEGRKGGRVCLQCFIEISFTAIFFTC